MNFHPAVRYSMLFSLTVKRTLEATGRIFLASEVLLRMKDRTDAADNDSSRPRSYDKKPQVPLPDGLPIIETLSNMDDSPSTEGTVEREIAKFLVDMEVYRNVAPLNEFVLIHELEFRRLRKIW